MSRKNTKTASSKNVKTDESEDDKVSQKKKPTNLLEKLWKSDDPNYKSEDDSDYVPSEASSEEEAESSSDEEMNSSSEAEEPPKKKKSPAKVEKNKKVSSSKKKKRAKKTKKDFERGKLISLDNEDIYTFPEDVEDNITVELDRNKHQYLGITDTDQPFIQSFKVENKKGRVINDDSTGKTRVYSTNRMFLSINGAYQLHWALGEWLKTLSADDLSKLKKK